MSLGDFDLGADNRVWNLKLQLFDHNDIHCGWDEKQIAPVCRKYFYIEKWSNLGVLGNMWTH